MVVFRAVQTKEPVLDPAPTSLSHVALLTRNLKNAVAFYRDFVGLSVVYATEHSAMLRVGDVSDRTRCGVVLFEPDSGFPEGKSGLVHHLGFAVESREEVDRWARKARDAGHQVQGPVSDEYIGYYCLLYDPDGNRLEFSAPEGVNRF